MGDSPELRSVLKRKVFYDPESRFYYKRAETLPGYNNKARNGFFDTMMSDPVWYVTILIKRVGRIFYATSASIHQYWVKFRIAQHCLVCMWYYWFMGFINSGAIIGSFPTEQLFSCSCLQLHLHYSP